MQYKYHEVLLTDRKVRPIFPCTVTVRFGELYDTPGPIIRVIMRASADCVFLLLDKFCPDLRPTGIWALYFMKAVHSLLPLTFRHTWSGDIISNKEKVILSKRCWSISLSLCQLMLSKMKWKLNRTRWIIVLLLCFCSSRYLWKFGFRNYLNLNKFAFVVLQLSF